MGLSESFRYFQLCKYSSSQSNPFLRKRERKTLPLEKPTAELLKKSLKDDGNEDFVLIEYKEFYFS